MTPVALLSLLHSGETFLPAPCSLFVVTGKIISYISRSNVYLADGLQTKQQIAPQKTDVTKKAVNKKSDLDAILDYIESGDTTTTQEEREQYAKRERNFKVEQKLYEAVNVQQFGWINIDRFLEVESRTDFLVVVNPLDSIINANVYLAFQEINSVTQQYYYNRTAKDNSLKFEGLPVGYKSRLIAYTVKDGKPYAFASDVTIGKNQRFDVTFKPVTEQEFQKMIAK
jgi:hypothetical protein